MNSLQTARALLDSPSRLAVHRSAPAENGSTWQRFVDLLEAQRDIKPATHRYYTRWVEQWHPDDEVRTREATERFFEQLGQRKGLFDWQFRQAVNAVRLWCGEIEPAPWAADFDWRGLADQAKDLEADHRSILREADAFTRGRGRSGDEGATAMGTQAAEALLPPPPSSADHHPAEEEERLVEEMAESVRLAVRHANLSVATEKVYVSRCLRFARFCLRRLGQNPLDSVEFDCEKGIAQYLNYLILERQVSPSTQRQALNALVFYARKVMGKGENDLEIPFRLYRNASVRPPVVLTRDEVDRIFRELDDPWKLICQLLYGSGLRQMEALRLRVKDIDFGQGTITIHAGKGRKHRVAPLPKALEGRLRKHLEKGQEKHRRYLSEGSGKVHLEASLRRKYPKAAETWAWQYVFSSAKLCEHPRTKHYARHHLHEQSLQRQFKHAVTRSEIPKRATCHTLRHSHKRNPRFRVAS